MDRMSSFIVVLSTIAACTAGGDDGSGFPSYPSGPATGKNDAIGDSGSSESEDDSEQDDDTSASHDDGEDSVDDSTTEPPDADTVDPDPSTGEAGDPET